MGYKSKKLVAFDLDGTLAESKSALEPQMGVLLSELLNSYEVLIISGGKFGQFEKQILSNLQATPAQLARLHLMPTCGTRYYRYDADASQWEKVYAEDFDEEEKARIINALREGVSTLGLEEKQTWGDTIEDRGSQITFSALGQDIVDYLGAEGVQRKKEWDPDSSKKNALRDFVAAKIPEFETRVGGESSIDITRPGIDKAYGMNKLMALTGLTMQDILFIGDRLQPGGNDYPVSQMGIDSRPVSHWTETAAIVRELLAMTETEPGSTEDLELQTGMAEAS